MLHVNPVGVEVPLDREHLVVRGRRVRRPFLGDLLEPRVEVVSSVHVPYCRGRFWTWSTLLRRRHDDPGPERVLDSLRPARPVHERLLEVRIPGHVAQVPGCVDQVREGWICSGIGRTFPRVETAEDREGV